MKFIEIKTKKIGLTKRVLTALCLAFVFSGCGAPLKSADKVKHIFSNSEQLNEKMKYLCNLLTSRNEIPNLRGIGLADEVCTKPASSAVNYSDLKREVGFSVVDSGGSSTSTNSGAIQNSDQLLRISTRSEIWLNRSLLEIAQVLFGSLQNETNNLLGSKGGKGSPKNGDFDFQIIGKPVFDRENFNFSMEFNLSSTREQNGQIDIANHFRVVGFLFEKKYFAATAETVEVQPKEKSLLRDGKILIVLVPHAGDLFLDVSTDLNFYSFGVDAVMKKSILEALGSGLKSIPDLIAGLEEQAQ